MSSNDLSLKYTAKIFFRFLEILLILAIAAAGYLWLNTPGKNSKKSVTPPPQAPIAKKINPELEWAINIFKIDSDNEAALKIFSKYAQQDDEQAMIWLCTWHLAQWKPERSEKIRPFVSKLEEKNNPYWEYFAGITANNHEISLDLLRNAADKNIPEACFCIAMKLMYETKMKDYLQLTEKYMKKAYELNYLPAKSEYAYFLMEQKRYDEALKILQDADDYYALEYLADCYYYGFGVPINTRKAVEIAEKALNSISAQGIIPVDFKRFINPAWKIYYAGLEELVLNGKTDFAKKCMKIAGDKGNMAEAKYKYATLLLDDEKPDTINAVHYLKKAANQDYLPAQYMLGIYYKNQKEYQQAAKYMSLAMNSSVFLKKAVGFLTEIYRDMKNTELQKHFAAYGTELEITSCRNTHALFTMQDGSDESFAKAAALFTLSSLEKNKDADQILEIIFEKEKNRLKRLAAAGNRDAIFTLAEYGKKQPKNSDEYKKGIEYFEQAVNMEHPLACYILANMYAHGIDLPIDLQKAMKYYKIGMRAGFKPATKNVIFLLAQYAEFANTPPEFIAETVNCAQYQAIVDMDYYFGMICKKILKNKNRAGQFFRCGAERGDVKCMFALYKSDAVDAHKFLDLAHDKKNYHAFKIKGDIEQKKGNLREAYINYLKSYNASKNAAAMNKIIVCLLNGLGCEANPGKAIALAEKLFDTGDAEICLTLGNIFNDGKFVQKDTVKAKKYYSEGVKRGCGKCKTMLDISAKLKK